MGQRPLPLLEGPLPLFCCLSGCDKIGPMRIIRQNLSCSYTDASIFTTSHPPTLAHITGYHQTGTSLVVRRSSIPFLCLPLMGQFTYLQLFTQKMFGYCILLPVISCICVKGYLIFLAFVGFEIRLSVIYYPD